MTYEIDDGNGGTITLHHPYGLNPIGHQGLFHDEELDLIYNRARMLHPKLGRFMQRDPLGYVDGLSVYAAYHVMHGSLDPMGLWWWDDDWIEYGVGGLLGFHGDEVQAAAWDAATGCKRKCGESVGECMNRIAESVDIQDQLFNAAIDAALDLALEDGFPSPTAPADLDKAAVDAALGGVANLGTDLARDAAGNRLGRQGVRNAVSGAIDLAQGVTGGNATALTRDISRNYARQVSTQFGKSARSVGKSAAAGLGKGLASWAAWEGGLRLGALAHCACEPTND